MPKFPTAGRRNALLVGINSYYLDETIGNLRYCVNDVNSLNEILINQSRGNFSTVLLTSDAAEKINEPNRANIMSMLKLISNSASSEDLLLFYFAGHGFESEGKNYILPADSRTNILDDSAISIEWVKETFKKSLAKQKLIVLDSCHSGSTLGRAVGRMSEAFLQSLLNNSEGMAIFCSCKAGQQACEMQEMEHGVFSYYLLEGLTGKADTDENGLIFLGDINQYVTGKLNEWGLRTRSEQNPTLQLDVTGDILLVTVPKESSEELPANFTISSSSGPILVASDDISRFFKEITFMSNEELYENKYIFTVFREYLVNDNNYNIKIEKSKKVIEEYLKGKFSASNILYFLIPIFITITSFKEIKMWLADKPIIKDIFITEFIDSGSFDYAGITSSIICNLIPAFSDEELLKIINGIKNNDQITGSFSARKNIIAMINASRNILKPSEYLELKNTFSD